MLAYILAWLRKCKENLEDLKMLENLQQLPSPFKGSAAIAGPMYDPDRSVVSQLEPGNIESRGPLPVTSKIATASNAWNMFDD